MKVFRYCPHCGLQRDGGNEEKQWICQDCGFIYYHNTAAAVAGVIRYQEEIAMTVRKRNPGKGMLDLPGGFVDYNETLEQALSREINEELRIDIAENEWRYLFSYPNRYHYAGVEYHTADGFFIHDIKTRPELSTGDDIADVIWLKIVDIKFERIGFESVCNAIRELQAIC
jgi:ADP-ribose pyrophosphatase YjhB (NUDIX family)